MSNALAKAVSPYLLQHRDNPVDWREWTDETLAEARRLDRPILLSVGYAACHWCHVMAHESFENPEIAARMNEAFINIKVDREERPDIDALYQQALALLGEQGGWPLTMFLTPGGEPFWGGTYFPPEDRYGRPSFGRVLEEMRRLWTSERHKVTGNRDALLGALARMAQPERGPAPSADEAIEAARVLGEEFDAVHGGLGGAPKFPQAPVLDFIWQAAAASGDRLLKERVLHTLARICQGGIHDHLGGGFARYSVDAYWLAPHFEKMLYDNAQLLGLLGDAFAETGDPLFRERAAGTVEWLKREMLTENGLAASLDADSEGEEGRFYVWDAAEIDRLLGADSSTFKLAYGVTKGGNWEGKTILHRLHAPGLPTNPGERCLLDHCRRILLDARDKRVRPGLDDKIMADWNGLAIQGLARAGFRFAMPEWIALARDVFSRVRAFLGDGADGLCHSGRAGKRQALGFLDDYAQMSLAALTLAQLDRDPALIEQARLWLDRAERSFADTDGGYVLHDAVAGGLPAPGRNAHSGPTPAPVASQLAAQLQLARLTGDSERETRVRQGLEAFAGDARRQLFVHASYFATALAADRPIEIVLVEGEGLDALIDAIRATPLFSHTLRIVSDPLTIPASSPAAGKTAIAGRATAYLCEGAACRPPVTDAKDFQALLERAIGPSS